MVTMNTTTPPVSPSRHIVPNSASKRACSLPQSTSHLRRRRALSTTFTAALPAPPADPFEPRSFSNVRAICKHCAEVYRPELSPCAPHCSIDCRTMDKLYARHLKQKLSTAENPQTEMENEENQDGPNLTGQTDQAPGTGSEPRLPSPPDTALGAVGRPRAKSAPAINSSSTTTNSSNGHPRSNSKSPTVKSGLHLMLSMDTSRRSETDRGAHANASNPLAPANV